MPLGLLILLRLQGRALLRRRLRGIRTPKGAVFALVAVLIVILWLAPSVFAGSRAQSDPQHLRLIGPLILLAVCLLNLVSSANDKAIAFTPAEIDFLFPAPFTRRQLLLYKITKATVAILVTGILVSSVLAVHAAWWLAAYLGVVLSLLFVQLLAMSTILIAQIIGQRAYSVGRKIVVAALLAIIALAIVPGLSSGSPAGFTDMAKAIGQSSAGRVLLAPLRVFIEVLIAPTAGALAGWAAAALAIDLAMLALVMRLDANYMEASMASSQKLYARLQRARSGGFMNVHLGGKARGQRPMFPYLGGAGTTAWRQLTAAMRNSRGILILLTALSLAVIPMLFSRRTDDSSLFAPVAGMLGWATIMIANMLRLDFRGDLEQMETLKSLPVRPVWLAVGQLLTPVLILSLCQVLVLASLAVLIPDERRHVLIAISLSLPFNALLIGLENLMFLMFPTRSAAASLADMQAFGRQIVMFFARVVILLIGVGIAAGVGALVYLLSGSWALATAAAAVLLMAEVAVLVMAIAWAYDRFDLSEDVPA